MSSSASHDTYIKLMKEGMDKMETNNIYNTAFGEIFLEDLGDYRESQLEKVGIKAHFLLWKRDTRALILEFIELGFKTKIVAANTAIFDEDFVGQDITKDLIYSLPDEVDLSGENGEFYTFCYDGPIFKSTVTFKEGEKVKKILSKSYNWRK